MTAWNPEANDRFLRAVELSSPEERRAYLDQACPENPELRAQVEALLAASERAGSLLEKLAIDPGATADPQRSPGADARGSGVQPEGPAPRSLTAGPGTLIGPYKLLQKLGEGGMGAVWMAEQEQPVKRRVAVKIIKPG